LWEGSKAIVINLAKKMCVSFDPLGQVGNGLLTTFAFAAGWLHFFPPTFSFPQKQIKSCISPHRQAFLGEKEGNSKEAEALWTKNLFFTKMFSH